MNSDKIFSIKTRALIHCQLIFNNPATKMHISIWASFLNLVLLSVRPSIWRIFFCVVLGFVCKIIKDLENFSGNILNILISSSFHPHFISSYPHFMLLSKEPQWYYCYPKKIKCSWVAKKKWLVFSSKILFYYRHHCMVVTLLFPQFFPLLKSVITFIGYDVASR